MSMAMAAWRICVFGAALTTSTHAATVSCVTLSAGGMADGVGTIMVLGQTVVGAMSSDIVVADCGVVACLLDDTEFVPGNIDRDGDVDGFDLALLLGQWTGAATYSPCPPASPADFNGDCKVNGFDLAILLGAWG